jgi:hypothetical protein
MKTVLIAALGAVLLVGAGCRKDNNEMDDGDSTMQTERSTTMSGADDCAMCEGNQKATATGKCPQCGMTLKTANR